jgi:hypothetical protein
MSKFVIWNVDEQKYVAPSGSRHSFVKNLQQAAVFSTKEVAQTNCCGNEFPRDVLDEVGFKQ